MVDRPGRLVRTLGFMRVDGEGGFPVEDICGLLQAIDQCYQAVALVELQAYRLLNALEWAERFGPPGRYWPPTWGIGVGLEGQTAPGDRLIVSRVVLESPGFWEVFGSLNPLEVVRKYLNDRHERQKDRDYRSDAERERLAIENALNRLQVVDRLAKLEREHGPGIYTSGAWLQGWEANLRPHLERLSDFDRRGLIAGETATSGPEQESKQ